MHPRFHLDRMTPMHRAERCGNAASGAWAQRSLCASRVHAGRLRLCAPRIQGPALLAARIRTRGHPTKDVMAMSHPDAGACMNPRMQYPPRSEGCCNPRIEVPTPVRGLRQPPHSPARARPEVTATLESGSPPRSEGCCNPRIGVPTAVRGLLQPKNRDPHPGHRVAATPPIEVPTSSRRLLQPPRSQCAPVWSLRQPGPCRCGPGPGLLLAPSL